MRFFEFANADEQMALWKLVSDNVWKAIDTQRQQEAQLAQARAAQAKLRPGKARKAARPKNPRPGPGPAASSTPPPTSKPDPVDPSEPKAQDATQVTQALRSPTTASAQSQGVAKPIATPSATLTTRPTAASVPAKTAAKTLGAQPASGSYQRVIANPRGPATDDPALGVGTGIPAQKPLGSAAPHDHRTRKQ